MFGLGWAEILILAFFIFATIAVWFIFVSVIARAAKSGAQAAFAERGGQAAPPARHTAAPTAPADDADARQTIIARLTQRFCPKCRSPLGPDAPEGLCPACLMAGGLASAAVAPPVNGLAATTPPSGSQPHVAGEWADLAQHFPHLEILELLGRGGMGTVYKARQKNLDRIVALKVIPPDAAKDPAFTERFNREAKAMARMNHPNIVTVYDFGQTGEVFWLLMEYVDGVNLRHALGASHLAPREALAIVPQICDALQYAHDQGVVHRDIKPENILLDRSGRVKIADFGLAKLLGKGPNDFTLTHTQQVMGTPRYMAPEQIEKPTTVDHRADIYSLGVVLYEMLTGELPLGRFEPPSHKVEVDVRIDQVVLRALEKSPDRRYQRASEVKTELASAVSWPVLAAPAAAAATTIATPPSWHTPSPATKESPTEYPSYPSGVPLGKVLCVASGMVMGVMTITAGLAAGIYAMTWGFRGFDGAYWGWMGAAFGCIVGGFGSTAGSYNTYRQMSGAEDLMRSPRTTWFDWVMRVYLVIGIGLLFSGPSFLDPAPMDETGKALIMLGAIATCQAVVFLILRTLMARRVAPAPFDPRREAIRRRVAGPGMGLMITGLFGSLFLPVVLALAAIPAWTLTPLPSKSTNREPLEFLDGPVPVPLPSPPPGFLPILSRPLAPGTLSISGLMPSAPLLVAQAGTTAGLGVWAIFATLLLILNLAFSVTLIIGGWRMRQLKSYGLAVIAAVLAMLPCTFGWFIGLPIGIWAFSTLAKNEVRDAFES